MKVGSQSSSNKTAASSTTEKQTAKPQILGRLKMGHRVIQLKKKIGQGGYATVYLAMDEDTYKEYVLKRMDCKVGLGERGIMSRQKRWKSCWTRSLMCFVS